MPLSAERECCQTKKEQKKTEEYEIKNEEKIKVEKNRLVLTSWTRNTIRSSAGANCQRQKLR